jgi:P-type Cu+ transporter
VNFGTERATVDYDSRRVSSEQLSQAIAEAGYTVTPVHQASPVTSSAPSQRAGETDVDAREARRDAQITDLKRKSLVSLAIGVVLMVMMYAAIAIDECTLAPFMLIASTVVQS